MNQETTHSSSPVDRSAVAKEADRSKAAQEVARFAGAEEDNRSAVPQEKDSPRCQHRTRTDRRCRQAVSDAATGLCSRHALSRPKHPQEADLAAAAPAPAVPREHADDKSWNAPVPIRALHAPRRNVVP